MTLLDLLLEVVVEIHYHLKEAWLRVVNWFCSWLASLGVVPPKREFDMEHPTVLVEVPERNPDSPYNAILDRWDSEDMTEHPHDGKEYTIPCVLRNSNRNANVSRVRVTILIQSDGQARLQYAQNDGSECKAGMIPFTPTSLHYYHILAPSLRARHERKCEHLRWRLGLSAEMPVETKGDAQSP